MLIILLLYVNYIKLIFLKIKEQAAHTVVPQLDPWLWVLTPASSGADPPWVTAVQAQIIGFLPLVWET